MSELAYAFDDENCPARSIGLKHYISAGPGSPCRECKQPTYPSATRNVWEALRQMNASDRAAGKDGPESVVTHG